VNATLKFHVITANLIQCFGYDMIILEFNIKFLFCAFSHESTISSVDYIDTIILYEKYS